MSNFQTEQAKLDILAARRGVYKGAADFISAPQTKDFAKALIARITGLRDDYIEKYDSVDPSDPISIARYQEARNVCNKILLDFDANSCKKAIERLDIEIKKIHNTMEQMKKAENQDGGFNSL